MARVAEDGENGFQHRALAILQAEQASYSIYTYYQLTVVSPQIQCGQVCVLSVHHRLELLTRTSSGQP